MKNEAKEKENERRGLSALTRLLGGIDFSEEDITKRAENSQLWEDLSKQNGEVLPYLIERFLLLENWRYSDMIDECGKDLDKYDVDFAYRLIGEMATVLLDYEQRIRQLEQ